MRASTAGHWQKGFTLLELLLAIFIFSIVISSVYGAYRATFHNITGTEAELTIAAQAQILLERISDDLDSLYSGEDGLLQGKRGDVGEYRADSLTCISSAHLLFNRSEQPAGLTRLSFVAEEDAETGLLRILRSDLPVRPGEQQSEQQGVVLAEKIREFKITYLDENGTEAEEWQSNDGNEPQEGDGEPKELKLPAMIRLEVRFAQGVDSEISTLFRTAVALPAIKEEES